MDFFTKPISNFVSVGRYILSPAFFAELFIFRSRLSFGRYERHNGDSLLCFFRTSADLACLLVDGVPIEQSTQYARVFEVLEGRAPTTPGATQMGRDVARTINLVEERIAGRDKFILCLTRDENGALNVEDGATRASVLLLTGESSAPARITPYK